MIPYRLEQLVDGCSDSWFEVTWVKETAQVVLLKLFVASIHFINGFIVLFDLDFPAIFLSGEDDVSGVVDNWVVLYYLLWAVTFIYLSFDISGGILHKDGGVRVGFRHLFLTLFETKKHVMTQDDWLYYVGAVVSGEHVDLGLINTKLADIGLEEENIGALHARVEDLRGGHFHTFFSSHDGTALHDTCDVGVSADVHDPAPVLLGSIIDFLRSPKESNVAKIHASSLPDLYKISTDHLNLVEVTSHFIV